MNYLKMLFILSLLFIFLGNDACSTPDTQESKDAIEVNAQQEQYAIGQPIPKYDWSLERHLIIQLYNIRNLKVATHAVWRGDTSVVEGDCPCIGYGLPYDVSLTNPLRATSQDSGVNWHALTSIGQSEPNGIYASTNTNATWVMCTGKGGTIDPVYVEAKVTGYPYPVKVDYTTNRVTRNGESSVKLSLDHSTVVKPDN